MMEGCIVKEMEDMSGGKEREDEVIVFAAESGCFLIALERLYS